MTGNIEGKLVVHDRHQFEMKLGYTLDPRKFHNNYKIELYFFIPRSLGINRHTYSKRYFFSDIQGYIRFKTPFFSFSEVVDPGNKRSPLTRVRNSLTSPTPDRTKIINELKLFACVFRVALRNVVADISKQIMSEQTEHLSESIEKLCSDVNVCIAEFRDMRKFIDDEGTNGDVKRAFSLADEYVGIILDDFLNSINNSVIDSTVSNSIKRHATDVISPIILAEFDYRRANGYAIYAQNSENELFLYRKSLLKKIITSILFLETHTQEGIPYVRDFVFAIAAGIAMIIAASVTIWAGLKWSTTSIQFVLAIVIGYMVKDRIKDWLKYVFSTKMTRWLSDYKTDIIDVETSKKIGICRQAFSFIPEKYVPKEIIQLRRSSHHHSSDFWLSEEIIKYEKDVTLRPGSIIKSHTRLGDITDIIRFNVHRFLDRMDDPYEYNRAYDTNTGNPEEFKCARVYHVNLVLKLSGQMKRFRLILDQIGLKRVEEVK